MKKKKRQSKAARASPKKARGDRVSPKPTSPAAQTNRPSKRSDAGESRERSRKATYAADRRSANSNIGPPPPCSDPKRRERYRTDLVAWHTEVFPNSTGLKPFGQAQLDSIKVSQGTLIHGGKTQKIEPRKAGKTTRTIQEAIWAICYEYRRYVPILAASTDKSDEIMSGIQLELETNDELFALFPEICHPFRCLDGKTQLCKAQHIDGEKTGIEIGRDRVVFPHVAGSPYGGARIIAAPFRSVRGLQKRTERGTERPDFVFIDDLQTDDDAKSKKIIGNHLKKLRKSIPFLGGPFSSLAILMTATIIEPDDVPDTLANDPAWVTVRYKGLESRAKNEDLWLGEYAGIRRNYTPGDQESQRAAWKRALKFYKKNRKKMDEGAVAYWQWAYSWQDVDACEISAIQHAYNVWIDEGEEAFFCEVQNEPIRVDQDGDCTLATRETILASIINLPRLVCPVETTRLVAHIDVHKNVLFYVILAAWFDNELITGHVVDYGTWPQQSTRAFTVRNVKRTIGDAFPKLDMKAAVAAAVSKLISELIGKTCKSQAGNSIPMNRIIVDANWGTTEKQVKQAIRTHEHRGLVLAGHGKAIGSGKQPIDIWKTQPGEETGDGWIRKRQGAKGVQTIIYDVNHWTGQMHVALATDKHAAGTITLFDDPTSKHAHDEFINQLLIMSPKRDDSGGNVVYSWECPPGGQNHWADNLVGCLAAASEQFTSKQRSRKTGGKSRFSL